MSVETQARPETELPVSDVSWFPLDEIREPGAYVAKGTGDLIRVVAGSSGPATAELIGRHQAEPILVTQISADPFVPISRARLAAANADIEVKF